MAQAASECGCARLQWQVLDFNEPAIEYYHSLGGRERVETVEGVEPLTGPKWLNYIMDREAIHALVARGQHGCFDAVVAIASADEHCRSSSVG